MIKVASNRSEVFEGNSVLFQENVVAGLRQLVEINKERIDEYLMALQETSDRALKPVFKRYLRQSIKFMNTLGIWINSYGGSYAHTSPEIRKKQKTWFGLRSILPASNREDIISACEYREAMAVDNYKQILALDQLPSDAFNEITRQKEQIERAFVELIALSAPEAVSH